MLIRDAYLQHDIAELFAARKDQEKILEFRINPRDTARSVKKIAVKNLSVMRVICPPGRLGVAWAAAKKGPASFKDGGGIKFEAPQDGIYIRNISGAEGPLWKALRHEVFKVISVEGRHASSLATAENAAAAINENRHNERQIVVQRLDGGLKPLGADIKQAPSGAFTICDLSTASPLLGYAAPGAEILEINGSKEGLARLAAGSVEDPYLTLTISTPPVATTRMEFISFFPLDFNNGKTDLKSTIDFMQSFGFFEDDVWGATNLNAGRYETVTMMKERMNAFLATTGLKVLSVETASIDGSVSRMNSGRYRSGGGDRAEWVYQTLRVWYNALDPHNLRPEIIEAIAKQNALADWSIAQAVGSCSIM